MRSRKRKTVVPDRALEADIPATLAGYRVVRMLAAGRRSRLFLGRSDGEDGAGVALKLFDGAQAAGDLEPELAALRLGSEHLPRLLDVAWREDLRCLVLERLSTENLGGLLAARGTLREGEAVTILVSVLRAVADLHRAGLSHGAVRAAAVLFDPGGRPVLTRLGHVRRREDPTASGPGGEEVAEDYRALADLAVLLLGAAGRHEDARRLQVLMLPPPTLPLERHVEKIEAEFFAVAEPSPIADAGRSRTPLDRVTGSESATGAGRNGAHARRDGPSRAVAPGSGAGGAEAASAEPRLSAFRGRLERLIGAHGKRLGYACVLAAGLVVAGVLALPGGGASGSASRASSAPRASSMPRASVAPRKHGSTAGRAPSAGAVPSDPVKAAPELLTEREECVKRASASCLHRVEQSGSPLEEEDQARVAGGATTVPGPGRVPHGGEFSLLGRSGSTALVGLSGAGGASDRTTTVLLIRTAGGWQLRDVFAGRAH